MRSPLLPMTLCLLALGTLCTGCGEKTEATTPVAGKVFLGDKVLTMGTITYVPDADKGNTTRLNPYSQIAEDGTYRLAAPVGWYKVVVATTSPSIPASRTTQIPPSYSSPNNTPLRVQVVEGATEDAYYIRLTP